MPPMKSAEPQQAEAASANAMPTPMILSAALGRRIDEIDDGLHGICRDRAGDRQRAHRLGDLRAGVVDRVRRAARAPLGGRSRVTARRAATAGAGRGRTPPSGTVVDRGDGVVTGPPASRSLRGLSLRSRDARRTGRCVRGHRACGRAAVRRPPPPAAPRGR